MCVYAVTSAPPRGRVTGIMAEPIRFVRVGRLYAAIGDVARVPRPSRAMLERYDRTIHSIAARCAAVLPAQFGTFVTGDEELALILRSRASGFSRALKQVRNRVQMTIRVVMPKAEGGSSASLRTGLDGPPHSDRSSGRGYLREKAAAATRARAVPGFEPVQQAVTRWVRDERVEKRGTVATIYHLIPRSSVAAYERAVRAAASGSHLRLVLSGPFPAYAFTNGDA